MKLLSSRIFHLVLIAVIMGALLGLEVKKEKAISGAAGFAMDDSWIHATLARNLVEGQGFSINKGEPVAISTSPAWSLMVAFFYFMTRNIVIAGLSASLLCAILATWGIYLLVAMLSGSKSAGLVSAMLLGLNSIAIWGVGSGMEIHATFLALILLFWAYYSGDAESAARKYGVPLALAFACATRPELFVLVPLAVTDTFFTLFSRREGNIRTATQVVLIQGGIFLVALAPYFIFDISVSGHLFPNTFYAKAGCRGVGLSSAVLDGNIGYVWNVLPRQVLDQIQSATVIAVKLYPFFFPLVPLGLIFFSRRFNKASSQWGWFLPSGLILLLVMVGIFVPTEHFANTNNRYYSIFIPFLAVAGGLGWWVLASRLRQRLLPFLVLSLTLLYFGFDRVSATSQKVAEDVRTVNRLYVEMAQWIQDNIEEDALLAVNDIGAVGFFSEQREIVDIMGLASPEIWPVLRRRKDISDVEGLKSYMRKRKVDYLIISPHYYPELTKDTSTFEEVARFETGYKIERSWNPQIIYRCRWNRE